MAVSQTKGVNVTPLPGTLGTWVNGIGGPAGREAVGWTGQPMYAIASISTRTSGWPKSTTTVVRAGGAAPNRVR